VKIQTMSVVVGTRACNAKCPFCVAKMSVDQGLTSDLGDDGWRGTKNIDWLNFKSACRCAQIGGATTVLLTGKGEPTLYPQQISHYLRALKPYDFPFIELQTNGIKLMEDSFSLPWDENAYMGQVGSNVPHLERWRDEGLRTVCISAVHIDRERNQEVYGEAYPDLVELVKKINHFGITVRLAIIMLKGYIDDFDKVDNVAAFCRENGIKQLTIRSVSYPEEGSGSTKMWTLDHVIEQEDLEGIYNLVEKSADPVLHLPHGATVYDYMGQNLCVSNCLTTNETSEEMRQIIFFPDGTISYDWCYKGAILL